MSTALRLGEFERVMAEGVVKAVRAADGYGGGVYLRSGNEQSLVLAAVAGVSRGLLRATWRVPVAGPLPVAEVYRSGRSIHLDDADETMRRFPQLAIALPYPFASVYTPVTDGNETVGVLVVLRTAAPDRVLTSPSRRRLRAAANRLGASLAALSAHGLPIQWDAEPITARLPATSLTPVRVGQFDWYVSTGVFAADDVCCAMLGRDRASFGGTVTALTARTVPEDAYELQAAAREAVETGKVSARRLRVLGLDDKPCLVELWAREVGLGPDRHLTGALVDPGTGITAAEAAERLPDGLFALDQDGRLTYANGRAEALLGADRTELVGSHPWDVLPWLADPAYEDRYRSAMLSQEPSSFLVRRTAGHWLTFTLYPDVHGLTGRVVPVEPPAEEIEGRAPVDAAPVPQSPSAAPARPGALYRVLQMASALTEAVTVRQVCEVVADQLLPTFAGQEVAIYTVRERHLHLAWQSGYPEGFLDPFEGVTLHARLPGVEALTSGSPIFFESERQLCSAYPGIPLDGMRSWAFLPLIASGRPVGSCIVGFDRPRTFTSEERTVLTALGGLIAQALERARLYDSESAVARGLQEALLPHRLPCIAGVETAGRYLPGTQGMDIGGDWYDVMETSRGVVLVIGDVEGHSVAAAAIMGQLRSAVRAFATGGQSPDEVMACTNRLLADLDSGLFATCCCVQLDPANGRAWAVRAGHPPPLLRLPDGRTEVLDLAGGVLLGVDREIRYPVTELRLPPGSVLALYTDGLVEQPGADIGQGIDRLRSALAHTWTDSLADTAERLVREARYAPDRLDDVALLLTCRRPAVP
ncbi:SpoIIE family protein phosphatase [Peterkaempfera bronchialis]|uniref:protein-serine/threonine phosphatase n=1 Tax=Peterkaempfera bronchialis TaxID=2126346 RepID=A0A345T1M7_9ACTN|nr:SpoIIE family protein phosphatase [Peterkaempfera bronchialis]AXI79882.1 GAF domain-containing protein [Peterkaempfera bronchialis]